MAADVHLLVSPAKARELDQMLDEWRRFNGRWPAQAPGTPTFGCVPPPKIGKARDNIAPRTFGAVDIWAGTPSSETQITGLTSPVQEFNLLDRTITAGKFVWMFGQYIFGATFPARQVDATLSAALSSSSAAGVSATVNSFTDGDNPGATITVFPPPQIGTQTVDTGKSVFALWDDSKQKYVARGWEC